MFYNPLEEFGVVFILRLNRSLPFYGFYGESCHWRRGHPEVELCCSPQVHLLVFFCILYVFWKLQYKPAALVMMTRINTEAMTSPPEIEISIIE